MTRLKQAWLALCGLFGEPADSRCTPGGVALADPKRLCEHIAKQIAKGKRRNG